MRLATRFRLSHIRFKFLALAVLMAFMLAPSMAQSDTNASTNDHLQTALQIARDLIEEERESPLTMVRWRFYQDDWSSQGSWQLYGSFGIDNCTVEIPVMRKRGEVRFGWTFSILDASGKEYQARVGYDFNDTVVCDDVRVPPAFASQVTAQPSEEAAPDLPGAVAGPTILEGFALGGHVDGLTPQAANLLRSAGMTWTKGQLPHSAGIATGTRWINDFHDKGFKILLSVPGDEHALANDFDGYVRNYASFLAQLAAAGADAIEVWNEPNLDREWPHGQINGASYVRMLAAAYNAIKGANANTIVISGAPAPTGYAGNAGCIPALCNDDVFMEQMANAGAAQYMDCLGLHYNEGVVSPRQSTGDTTRNYYPTQYFGSMLNRGARYFPNTRICWTELGYLSGEGMGAPIPQNFSWANNVTVAQQTEWIADAARLSKESGRVALMIVWNINFTRWDSDPMGGYALLRPDGTCPGCTSLGALMSMGG